MLSLYFIIPLLVVVISTFVFNYLKVEKKDFSFFLISTLQATISVTLITLLFLFRFLPSFVWVSISIGLILFVFFAFIMLDKMEHIGVEVHFETIKNNVLFFSKTILPLYLFLIMFRYMSIFIQVPLAIVLTGLLYYLSLKLQKRLPSMEHITIVMNVQGNMRNLLVTIGIIFGISLLFNLPQAEINNVLNTSNSRAYLVFDGLPYDVQNNFEEIEIARVDVEMGIYDIVIDYYYDDDYLFVFYDTESYYYLKTYDIATGEETDSLREINNNPFSGTEDGLETGKYTDVFIEYDNQVLFKGASGTYLVEDGQLTLIV